MAQETIEEAADKFAKKTIPEDKFEDGLCVGKSLGFIEGAKWQAGRMYSEEEVYTIASYLFYNMVNSEKGLIHTEESFKKWFEQVKKK